MDCWLLCPWDFPHKNTKAPGDLPHPGIEPGSPELQEHFPGGSEGSVACHAGGPGLIPGSGRPLEKDMATRSSTVVWRIPWMEEPGRLKSMGSQRVGHDWATSLSLAFSWTAGRFFTHWATRKALIIYKTGYKHTRRFHSKRIHIKIRTEYFMWTLTVSFMLYNPLNVEHTQPLHLHIYY